MTNTLDRGAMLSPFSLDFTLTVNSLTWGGTVGILKQTVALTRCAGRNWVSDNASTTGASLAFFCAFSLAPLLVIVLTIVGWIVGASAAYTQIGRQLTALFGPATAKGLLAAIQSSQRPEGLAATLSVR